MENLENKHGGFQAGKSLEVTEIRGYHGEKVWRLPKILECHDKSVEIYLRCVLQFDLFSLQRNQVTNQLEIVMDNFKCVMEVSWRKIIFQFVWEPCAVSIDFVHFAL